MGDLSRDSFRLLVADDDMASRFLISEVLRGEGYTIEEAEDGAEAWRYFEANPGKFSLLVTDVMMPRMNGLELAEKVRAAAPAFPIVLLTALGDKDTIKQALRLGVNDFMEKPVDMPALLTAIAHLLTDNPALREHERHMETVEAVRRAHRVLASAETEGLPLEVRYEPYKDAGGDVFRCLKCADGSCIFVLADVAGHSVESSYAVASFLGIFAAHTSGSDDLMPLLRNLNAQVQRGPFPDIAVSAILCRWHPATGRLHLANAGMPHVRVWRHQRGRVERIALNGTPLGYFPEPSVEEQVLLLEEGDRLLLGSDGVFDALSPAQVPFEEQAEQFWAALHEKPLGEAVDSLCQAVRDWRDGPLSDDLLLAGLTQPAAQPRAGELSVGADSTREAVDALIGQLEHFLRSGAMGMPVESARLFDVKTAVREALLNAVLHGNRNKPGARVGLRCWRMGRGLTVAVTDEGTGFDARIAPPQDEELREGSRGLPLMRHLADALSVIPGEARLTFHYIEG